MASASRLSTLHRKVSGRPAQSGRVCDNETPAGVQPTAAVPRSRNGTSLRKSRHAQLLDDTVTENRLAIIS
jgi:hypothetical protein